MTLSQVRFALLFPLALGCAHAVYDGQPDLSDMSNANDQPINVAGAGNVVNMLPMPNVPDPGSAGETSFLHGGGGAGNEAGTGGTPGSAGSENKATGGGGTAGVPGTAGTTNRAGAPSGGAPSGGAPSGGVASGGAATAGSSSAGSPATGAGAGSTDCSGISAWTKHPYAEGDKVQSNGKIYKCKAYPFSGWCGTSDAYAPPTGFAWMDAWELVGPC